CPSPPPHPQGEGPREGWVNSGSPAAARQVGSAPRARVQAPGRPAPRSDGRHALCLRPHRLFTCIHLARSGLVTTRSESDHRSARPSARPSSPMSDLTLTIRLSPSRPGRTLGPARAWRCLVAPLDKETVQLEIFGRGDSGWRTYGVWMLPERCEL